MADEKLKSGERVSVTPAAINDVMGDACERVPGMRNGVLVLLAEGVAIGAIGTGSAFECEPLVRAAVRCLSAANALARPSRKATEFVEYSFVAADQITIMLRGRREPRVALVLACARESNLAFVLTAARRALAEIETTEALVDWVV